MSLPPGRHQQHQFTDEQVKEMRELYEGTKNLPRNDVNRWTYRRLAEKFGASHQTISKIVNYHRYEWVQ